MKKALQILKTIVTWLILLAAVGMMIFTIVSVLTFDRMDRNILGYKAFIVRTDSMSATDFSAGDLILAKKVDPKTLREGDIITFQSVNPDSYGEVITHKIRSLTTDADGNPGFITYGTTTDTNDETVVTYSFVLGKYQGRLPGVGRFFQFLKTTPGYIVCILIPFLALILMQGVNSIRLFRRYRLEQMEEMNAERKQLEAERLESQKMMQELLALRAQLSGGAPAQPTPPTEAPVQPPVQPAPPVEQPVQPAPPVQPVPPVEPVKAASPAAAEPELDLDLEEIKKLLGDDN